MQRVETLIKDFVEHTGLTERHEIIHGTLYVTLKDPKGFDHFHKTIRTFFKEEVDNEGGVNMYAVGDEFAFDFVPEDREAPVFCDEKFSGKEEMNPTDTDDKGIWSEFAEEEMLNNVDLTEEEAKDIIGGDLNLWGKAYPDVELSDKEESDLDILMNLEAESKRGK